jgi:phytoene dehydrogenase-like protein
MDDDTMNPRARGKFFDRLPGISNLYFCGQQTGWPGAAGSALSSGVHMADLII